MRLEAQAKGGYYPVSLNTIKEVCDCIDTKGNRIRMLDPCCGKGDALLEFGRILNISADDLYGCEIERERFKESKANLPGSNILEGDGLSLKVNSCFNLIWVNPPYDNYGSTRYEWLFLSKMVKYASCEGAVVIWHVPEKTVLSFRYSDYLEKNFCNSRIIYPKDRPYNECVFIGNVSRLSAVGHKRTDEKIAVPSLSKDKKVIFRMEGVPPSHILDLVKDSPLMRLLHGKPASYQFMPSPPMQVKKQHLAMLLGSGILDGVIESPEGKMLIKASSTKELVLVEEINSEEKVVSVFRERPRTVVRVLDEKGNITNLG